MIKQCKGEKGWLWYWVPRPEIKRNISGQNHVETAVGEDLFCANAVNTKNQ